METDEKFDEYFRIYFNQVFGFMYNKVSNRETAEDLAIEVFEKCYETFDKFDESRSSFKGWIFRLAYNRLADYFSNRKEAYRKKVVSLEDHMEYICMERIYNFEDDMIAAIYIENLRDSLADAFEALNETQRKIVILTYFRYKTSQEIADIMGMTAGNVRVILSRARNKIESFFEKNNIKWEG